MIYKFLSRVQLLLYYIIIIIVMITINIINVYYQCLLLLLLLHMKSEISLRILSFIVDRCQHLH